MQIEEKKLIERAKAILYKNWRSAFTVPTNKLYPFQWNWDSGFVSLGWGHFNLDYAIQELRSLFSGQWKNGMIPHIIFHSEKETSYFPNFDFWEANHNSGAPTKPKTSGITQPPVQGFVLEKLFEQHPNNPKLIQFIQEVFLKVVNYHRFFYTYRDPYQEGLAFIFHPWESGRDNSPLWDDALNKITLDQVKIPEYTRRDTSITDPSERPTSAEYDRYVYLLELGKKHAYDGPGIVEESPFLIQDTLLNAILIKSNESLIRLGEQFNFDTSEIKAWQAKSIERYNEKLWNESLGLYTGYDLRNQKSILHKEIGGIVALFAKIPTKEQAARINGHLQQLIERGYFVCPSFDVDSPLFDSKRYWRGPIWPQMNWLLYHGLKNYGYHQTAETVKSNFLELVSKLGFHEYFEPQKHLIDQLDHGYGGDNFSWTASSFLDLIYSE